MLRIISYASLIACIIGNVLAAPSVQGVDFIENPIYNSGMILDEDHNLAVSFPEMLDNLGYHGSEAFWSYFSHTFFAVNLDTDGDGNIDYDERYDYGTDPYKADSEWNKTFEDGSDGNSVQQTIDGGYVVTGESSDNGNVMLLKTDSEGNKSWSKKIWRSVGRGNSVRQTSDQGYIPITNESWMENRYGISVRQTSDQGYIALCNVMAHDSYIWLFKTDPFGNELWNKRYGESPIRAYGTSIQQTRDEGYIILGSKEVEPMPETVNVSSLKGVAPSQGVASIWLIKTDSSGNKIWDSTYGGLKYDESGSVQQTKDGGYIIIGTTRSYGNSKGSLFSGNIWLIRTDSLGNKLWDKTFGGSYAQGRFVQQTTDGGYVLLGNLGSTTLLIKTDANGNEIWEKTFSFSSVCMGNEVLQTTDGGYILEGSGNKGRGWDAFLIKIDQNGNKLWDETFGSSEWDYGDSVDLTKDGGYIVAGRTRAFNGNDMCWLIKVKYREH